MPSVAETLPAVTGLSSESIPGLQKKYGKNEYRKERKSAFWIFLSDLFKEPLLLLLVISGCLYFILGQTAEGIMMLVAIVLVGAIGFFQEVRSAKAIKALKNMISIEVTVIRDGIRITTHSRELVPGDIMFLEEGNKVPADGRILEAHDLTVDEAVLTGESLPVSKSANLKDSEICQGTLINSGSCLAMVTATGNNTQLVKIGRLVDEYAASKTVLQIQLTTLVRRLALFGLIAFILIFTINYLHYRQFSTSLLFALTLAMSVIPEEIPVAFSSFMALGAYKMSRLGIFSRQPQIIENLGSMDVICFDKTGTITENSMTVQALYDYGTKRSVDHNDGFGECHNLLLYGALACEAVPFDAMEKAILKAFTGLKEAGVLSSMQMIHEYPLSGTPPMMTHVYRHNSHIIAAAKGAPERIISICNLSDQEKSTVQIHLAAFSAAGYRVLGVASADAEQLFPVNQDDFNWRFAGLLALYDPPKKNAGEVIRLLHAAKINVKLVTGDYAPTALTIAGQVGINTNFPYQTGEDVMRISDEQLRATAATTSIYARMFPEAKLRLVKCLRATGHTVAMTGDGVNDAPALKAADIGIAMGNHGTEMAQQAADLVIADDDLSKINLAVTEGRKIYQNLRKAVRYIIAIHTPIILIATLPLILGWKFPNIFTPIHIIFLELIMGPTCSIFFEKEPVADVDLGKGPRKKNTPLLRTGELLTSIVQGSVIAAGILVLYYWSMQSGRTLADTRTIVFTTLLLANIFLTFSVRSYSASIIKTLRYKNNLSFPIVLISASFLTLILLFPPARELFGLSTLSAGRFGLCVAMALTSVGWFEVYKANLPVSQESKIPRRKSGNHL